jgi:ClpP class serine protease
VDELGGYDTALKLAKKAAEFPKATMSRSWFIRGRKHFFKA